MKNNTYFGRQHIFRWLLLCWLLVPWVLQAQARITWTAQVGCQEFRGEKDGQIPDNGIAYSYINSSQCLRVCEVSDVVYEVQGPNVSAVQWTVAGGTVTTSGPGNTIGNVAWGTAGNGSLQAVITYSDGTVETQTICIEKINRPIAKFEMLNLDEVVCRNTTIYFDNLSDQNGGSDIVNYFWDFGDNTTSTAFEPSHLYANPGNYTIQLTVTNKCGCQSKYKKQIKVLKADPVQINCASVVCEGSKETYSAQDGCSKGQWKVIGGTIVGTNGNEIEVVWDQVDPLEGFGYVMYMSECACPEWTTIKIPVVLKNAKIKGQAVICSGRQYTYSIPQWPTTKVLWNVTGPAGGQLTNTQQRNEIVFSANQPGTYHLTANYFNTLLSCEGQASIDIVVEAPVLVSGGVDEICAGTSQGFTASPNVPVIWKVTTGSSTYTSPAMTGIFNYNFATAGTYTVTATKQGGGCESNARIIKVLPIPQPPLGTISGETKVCPGRPYVYTISSVDSGMVPVWSVTNGTIQGSNAGSSVTVIFNAGATSYTVSAQNKSISNAGCLSAPKSFNVTKLDLSTIVINPNSGPFCPSSTQTFSANLNGIVPDSMEWSFASSNFGSVVGGQGTANITVNFNEISSTSTTDLILKVVKCGVTQTITMPVSLITLPIVSFTNVGGICLGSNLTFTVNQGTITSATNVTFTFANGTPFTTAFNPSGVYSFPNTGYIQNNSGNNVSQTVTVTYEGTNGCNYKPTASANFIIYPETIITISPVYNIAVCDPTTMAPYTLTANSSTGLTNIVSWQWYKDNTVISGATTNSYVIFAAGAFGTYKVQAVDINGCVVYSQNVNVTQSCPSSGSCTTDPQINFVPAWSACNNITVSGLTYNGIPDQIQWLSDSVLTLVSGQGTASPVYQTNLAGAHIVFVRLRYGSCWYSKGVEVRKHYEPKFNISTVCNGSGYTVTLFNTSTIFDINPASVTYTFTSSGQPTQTGQSATYNLMPGTYTFTMTVSSPGKPTCTTTQTITLAPVPDTTFLVPAWLCARSPITFSPITYVPGNTYTWIFDGTSYITTGPDATITYNTAGTKTIQLKIRTPMGCEYTSAVISVNVKEASLDGTITPPSLVACMGSAPNIVFTSTVGTPSQYIWMNGSQPVPGAPNSQVFTPTQSGSYWPVLVSSDGCRSNVMSAAAVPVTLKNPPYVNISGTANICDGSSTVLTGIVTDNTLEYQWKKGNSIVTPWASAPYPIALSTGPLSAGTYVYTLEVRTPGTSGCTSSKSFTVTVSSPPAPISVSYSLVNCQPYEIMLTASGPSAGVYNWSNGMTGQSITVNEGGAYQVIYTAPSGCKVVGNTQVPLSLESLMWVFPTGCYDECLREGHYILGPKGVFDHHEWQLFGNNIQSGNNDYIYPLYINYAGTYQLQIDHLGCQFTSGTMNYYPGKECGFETDCKLEADIKGMKWFGDHYKVYGVIYNTGSQPISLTVSSLNGFGVYIPSIITIPAGGMYDMNANPLAFYPNSGFQGADEILFSNDTCKFTTKAVDPDWMGMRSAGRNVVAASVSSLKMIPNPAKEKVKISYNTGDEKLLAKQVTVFDAMGNIKFRKELKAASGEVDVEVTSWLQGVYIVIVQTGDTSLQGKLIKN